MTMAREAFDSILEGLTDAVAYMECKMIEQVIAGDHVLYIGEIVGGGVLKGGDPHTHVRASGYNY